MTGPAFSAPPRFNHVAVSVPPDDLDADGRAAICDFYGDVLGFEEHPSMTEDRRILVLGAHSFEQFVFVVARDEPMQVHVEDHYGLSVASKDDFDEVARRAAAWKERLPDEVIVDGPSFEDHAGVLRLHSIYLNYRLPLTVEVQFFDWSPNVTAGGAPDGR
jgi:hypothetical protein